MTNSEWYALLEMPDEVTAMLEAIGAKETIAIPDAVKAAYLCRETAEKGYEQLKALVGEDQNGMKMLYAVLQMAGETWEKYREKGIPADIFSETMKLASRFLRSRYGWSGEWKFVHGWWIWRELAMAEYRVGCLEYELVEEKGRRFVSLHIPSDADMSAESIEASFADFKAFLQTYYPEWENLPWECDSWMMSPALEELLPERSKILAFNRRFQVMEVNEDSLGVLEWVFPGYEEVSENLPEKTSLQRKMKKWLLEGKKVGWTRAVLRSDAVPFA